MLTLNTYMLSSTINEDEDINKVAARFMKKLNGCVAASFQKWRVRKKKTKEEDDLYEKRRLLKQRSDNDDSKEEVEKVEEEIAEKAYEN